MSSFPVEVSMKALSGALFAEARLMLVNLLTGMSNRHTPIVQAPRDSLTSRNVGLCITLDLKPLISNALRTTLEANQCLS
ncbi:hypothetical protein METHP14_70023 [Pseudomonas sp. P14-2025]